MSRVRKTYYFGHSRFFFPSSSLCFLPQFGLANGFMPKLPVPLSNPTSSFLMYWLGMGAQAALWASESSVVSSVVWVQKEVENRLRSALDLKNLGVRP